jgi:hypothetical protein
MTIFVPPPAMQSEISKPWYFYFGVNLAPRGVIPPPKWQLLGAANGRITAQRRISTNEFRQVVTFSFPLGNDVYNYSWRTCVKDTEPEDGIGLPGHHGCGDKRLLAAANYAG